MLKKDTIATIEDSRILKEKANAIRAKVSLTLRNCKPPQGSLEKNEQKALKKLQFDTSVAILPADK